jgi:hypothetical protein
MLSDARAFEGGEPPFGDLRRESSRLSSLPRSAPMNRTSEGFGMIAERSPQVSPSGDGADR